jgi:competence protein ComEA
MLRTILFVLFTFYMGTALAAPVNINTASAKEIASSLSGIGEKKALAIVEYRKVHGDFHSANDLTKVKGIGKKTVANNVEEILLGEHKHDKDKKH